MKTKFLYYPLLLVLFSTCTKSPEQSEEKLVHVNAVKVQRVCKTYEVFMEQLKADPSLQQKMDEIENFTQRYIKDPAAYRLLADGTLELPIVVNVLYNTAEQNISDRQIKSQIDVLNEDFAATNKDLNSTPTYNSVKSGDIKIKFVLQQTWL